MGKDPINKEYRDNLNAQIFIIEIALCVAITSLKTARPLLLRYCVHEQDLEKIVKHEDFTVNVKNYSKCSVFFGTF